MRSLMDWVRRALGYEISHEADHESINRRLKGQQLRIEAIDAAIQAQNAARTVYRGPERRRVPR